MKTELMDTKAVADRILNKCREEAEDLKKKGIFPGLAILRVGENAADISYEKGASKTMESVGIEVKKTVLPEDVSQEAYIQVLQKLNTDPSVHGILTLRPLRHLDERETIGKYLDPGKDVDGCTPGNLGKLMLNDPSGLIPCTAGAVMEILSYYREEIRDILRKMGRETEDEDPLRGTDICIVNNSNVIGKPLSLLLTNRFASVSVIHHLTLPEMKAHYAGKADVLITAVPVKNAVTEDMVKPGAVVVDASVIREKVFDEDQKPVINEKTGKQKTRTLGCLTEEAKNKAGLLTPVPGVGAVTSACLVKNLITACKIQNP